MPVARSRARTKGRALLPSTVCGTPPKWVKALYGGNAFAPIRAPLIEKRFDEESAGVAQDRDEHEDPHRHAGDQNPFLAKVDLQLIARRRLDSHTLHVILAQRIQRCRRRGDIKRGVHEQLRDRGSVEPADG